MSTFNDELDSISALLTPRNVRESVILVPLDEIQVDPNQPRKSFDQEAMGELIESIKHYGVLQPIGITGQEIGGKHTIVFGERRYRACLAIGKKEIPTIKVRGHVPDVQMIENIQREDLNPMEIAQWIQEKVKKGEKIKSISERLGKSKEFVMLHRDLMLVPAHIMQLYEKGYCMSPRSLINLHRFSKNNSSMVEKFCKSADKPLSRSEINKFIESSKEKPYTVPSINLLSKSQREDSDANKKEKPSQQDQQQDIQEDWVDSIGAEDLNEKGVVVLVKSKNIKGYLNLNECTDNGKLSVIVEGKNQRYNKDDICIEAVIA